MRKSGINLEQVKKENRSLIIKCINNGGPLSRKDIAEKTGLTPASVTQITTQLIAENILFELGNSSESTGTAGRKKVLLDVNAALYYVCSVNIETQYTTIAICDLKGNIVNAVSDIKAELSAKGVSCDNDKTADSLKEKGALCHVFRTALDLPPEKFIKKISSVVMELMSLLPPSSQDRLKCISVGIPGIVDKATGRSIHAYGIWDSEVDIRDILEKELAKEVYVTNNVDAFATAEILFGAGRFYDSLLVIKWGPGVGSTIVIDNKVYEGRHGKTAELGHFIVQKNGRKCSCGRRGCLETLVSYNELIKILGVSGDTNSRISFEKQYTSCSKEKKEQLDNALDIFAGSIVNTCTIIAPNRIILSGSLFTGNALRDAIIKACSSYDPAYNSGRILYTSLSEKESYIGPVAVYVCNLFQ